MEYALTRCVRSLDKCISGDFSLRSVCGIVIASGRCVVRINDPPAVLAANIDVLVLLPSLAQKPSLLPTPITDLDLDFLVVFVLLHHHRNKFAFSGRRSTRCVKPKETEKVEV